MEDLQLYTTGWRGKENYSAVTDIGVHQDACSGTGALRSGGSLRMQSSALKSKEQVAQRQVMAQQNYWEAERAGEENGEENEKTLMDGVELSK